MINCYAVTIVCCDWRKAFTHKMFLVRLLVANLCIICFQNSLWNLNISNSDRIVFTLCADRHFGEQQFYMHDCRFVNYSLLTNHMINYICSVCSVTAFKEQEEYINDSNMFGCFWDSYNIDENYTSIWWIWRLLYQNKFLRVFQVSSLCIKMLLF